MKDGICVMKRSQISLLYTLCPVALQLERANRVESGTLTCSCSCEYRKLS